MKFEFDEAKSHSDQDKHGINFIDAQALWQDDNRLETASKFQGEEP